MLIKQGGPIDVEMTYDLKKIGDQRPLFCEDAMRFPWAWVSIGASRFVRYLPEKNIVELGVER